MATFNRAEFLQELEATEEDYIERKLALGGYSGLKKKLVIEWLQRKAEKRRKELEALELQAAFDATHWNRLTAIATGFMALLAIAGWCWPK
jgi:hypothetical protein